MQPVNQSVLDLGLEKYGLAVVNVPNRPTLYKIVDSSGKMASTEFFSSNARAELALMTIVNGKEAKKSK